MIRRPPRSTLFPTRRSSDLADSEDDDSGKKCCPIGAADFWPHKEREDRKSTRLNSSHMSISYAVFCLKKKKKKQTKNYNKNYLAITHHATCKHQTHLHLI